MLSYWIPSLIFLFLDYYLEKKEIIQNYKIQHKGVVWSLYPKTIIVVLVNQFVITLPALYVLKDFHQGFDDPKYSDISWVVWGSRMFLLLALSDLIFYLFHYLLHHPWLYKHIHKIHHEWKAPVACRALYAHPVEHLVGNVFPFYAPLYFLELSWNTLLLWMIITSVNTTCVHSGYSLGYLKNNKHDLHHQKFNVNYGVFIWDAIFGTDYEENSFGSDSEDQELAAPWKKNNDVEDDLDQDRSVKRRSIVRFNSNITIHE